MKDVSGLKTNDGLATSAPCATSWASRQTVMVSISFYFWTGHCKKLSCNRFALEDKYCTQRVPRNRIKLHRGLCQFCYCVPKVTWLFPNVTKAETADSKTSHRQQNIRHCKVVSAQWFILKLYV